MNRPPIPLPIHDTTHHCTNSLNSGDRLLGHIATDSGLLPSTLRLRERGG